MFLVRTHPLPVDETDRTCDRVWRSNIISTLVVFTITKKQRHTSPLVLDAAVPGHGPEEHVLLLRPGLRLGLLVLPDPPHEAGLVLLLEDDVAVVEEHLVRLRVAELVEAEAELLHGQLEGAGDGAVEGVGRSVEYKLCRLNGLVYLLFAIAY